MAGSRGQLSWWEAFQGSQYPSYVTCIQPPLKSITLSSTKPRKISVVALDDVMDSVEDEDEWQPRTFELRKGSCVFVLPDDANKPNKASVSAPWMVRINQMWFTGGNHPSEPITNKSSKADKAVRAWELQQLRQERLGVQHFRIDMNYFYRLSDLYLVTAFGSKSDRENALDKGKRNTGIDEAATNIEIFCNALLTLGVVDSFQAAAELIKQGSGNTSARRMLSRFVCYSTHEGKLLHDDTDDDDDKEDDEDQEEAQPMESIMAPFKVFFLGASQRLPYKKAPVASAVEMGGEAQHVRSLTSQHLAAVLAQQQQQHEDLPPGFFCSLIYVKQTGQLFRLEEWAAGTAGSNIKGRWVQDSRKQVKELLAKTRQELWSIYQGVGGGPHASNGHAGAAAAAAAGAGDDSEADLGEAAMWQADQAAYPSTGAGASGQQQQHSQQQGGRQQLQPHPQPQRKTPRKRQRPRRAAQQSQQQGRRGRLRRASQLAASSDGEGSAGKSDSEEADEEEAAGDAPGPKRRRVAPLAAQDDSSGESSDDAADSSSEDAADAGVSAGAAGAAHNHAAAAVTGRRSRGAEPAKGRQQAGTAAQQRGSTGSRLRCSRTPVLRTPKTG